MRQRRSAYTLLEVILSLAISVLVLSAVYSVIGYQLRQAQAGREVIERSILARAIFNRMGGDITAAIAQNDPARFRRSNNSSGGTSGSNTTGTASGTSGTTGTTSSGTTTSGNTSTGGTTGTGSTTTGSSTTGGTSGTGSDSTATADTPIQLPLGVVGTATELHLFVSKIPQDGPTPPPDAGTNPPPLVSDLQRISYWLGDQEAGLCRFESRLITSDDATNPSIPSGDTVKYRMAPEVRSLEFSYFDGTTWAESWDSTSPGPDGVTPLGSPRAVAVKIGVPRSGNPDDTELRYHRQVFTVLTAGGTPVNNSTTNPAAMTSGSSTP